jgi:hypothetical protein
MASATLSEDQEFYARWRIGQPPSNSGVEIYSVDIALVDRVCRIRKLSVGAVKHCDPIPSADNASCAQEGSRSVIDDCSRLKPPQVVERATRCLSDCLRPISFPANTKRSNSQQLLQTTLNPASTASYSECVLCYFGPKK